MKVLTEQTEFSDLEVMVVDDTRHGRKLVCQTLKNLGCTRVEEATDGADAIFRMTRCQVTPDVIISTLKMRPVDGLKLARFIRKSPESPDPYLPVVMYSAAFSPKAVYAARDAGVNEVLAAPFSTAGLKNRLRAVIYNPRAFVRTGAYFGPDRRRVHSPAYDGPERRSRMSVPEASESAFF